MSKERRLGRGLEALLGRGPQSMGEEQSAHEKPSAGIEPVKIPRPTATSQNPQQAAVDENKEDENTTGSETTLRVVGGSDMGENSDSNPDSVHSSTSQEQTPSNSQTTPFTPQAPNATDESPSTSETNPPGDESKKDTAMHGNEKADLDLVQVNVALIETNPFQPRKKFEDESMSELAESISAHGLLQPIVARRVDDVYQLIAGERRLRAAKKAGLEEVPVRVIDTDGRGAAELALVENLQRKDLNALEKAASFKRYLKEHRCTQGQLANRLKIDRSTIANLMRLLELPEEVQKAVTDGKISQGHARALLPLGEQREQIAFCKKIQNDGLSVRKTETLVQETIQKADAEPLSLIGRDGKSSKQPKRSEHIASLEQEFRAGLGTKVQLTQGNGGSGKLVIQFKNHDEFNRIKEHILGPNKPQEMAG
ncbi:MAG: ParB/RepB/Spo0J family partition protein [Pirellulales bacterium]|nr:ParB/RepB/Spo0J family partition protein [Pirellulales bacterium]